MCLSNYWSGSRRVCRTRSYGPVQEHNRYVLSLRHYTTECNWLTWLGMDERRRLNCNSTCRNGICYMLICRYHMCLQ